MDKITNKPISADRENAKEEISRKPTILTFVGHYLPGFKAGGILRSIYNTIDNLSDEFDFFLVTRDRDLGDNEPYPDIVVNVWQQVENARVYYLSPESESIKDIYGLIKDTHHDILFLNSYFDPLTIKVLLNRRFRKAWPSPVIVATHGEFAWASLSQKYIKKFIYIQVARVLGLYRNVTWRVASEFEATDVLQKLKIHKNDICVAGDPPIKSYPDTSTGSMPLTISDHKGLKIVFLSRIAREKNLDYALRVLSQVREHVYFDIYGPIENRVYWKECQEIISHLPENVTVKYIGKVNPHQVIQVFSSYDLFLFPSGGESYGNVIAESLSAGTPVVLSTETPWRNLESDGLGWDLNLENMNEFVIAIEEYARLTDEQRLEKRTKVKQNTMDRLYAPEELARFRNMFIRQLG